MHDLVIREEAEPDEMEGESVDDEHLPDWAKRSRYTEDPYGMEFYYITHYSLLILNSLHCSFVQLVCMPSFLLFSLYPSNLSSLLLILLGASSSRP